MKKLFIFLTALTISVNITAQFYVSQTGNVGIHDYGYDSSSLYLKGSNHYNAFSIIGGRNCIEINNNESNNHRTGIFLHNLGDSTHSTTGINIQTGGYSSNKIIGIKAYGGNSSNLSLGIAGSFLGTSVTSGAGIFGTTGLAFTIADQYAGKYAGYFRGDVRVTGSLYANLLTPSAMTGSINTSTNSVQVLSTDIDELGESVSEKLCQVRLLRINNETSISATDQTIKKSFSGKSADIKKLKQNLYDGEELTQEEMEVLENSEEDDDVPQTQMAPVRYGLAADQLKEVYPELVYEDANGNVSINYIEMVPLLVQSLNEQQHTINKLQQRIEALEDGNASLKGEVSQAEPSRKKGAVSGDTSIANDIISLGQNHPNPFTENTSIEVNIPESVRKSALFIYDMSGKQVEKIPIAERGKSSISVSATGLHEGMYLYSLIADGKVIDTRKMILTK